MLEVPRVHLQTPDQGVHVAFIVLAMVVTAGNRSTQVPTRKVNGERSKKEAKEEEWKTPLPVFPINRMKCLKCIILFLDWRAYEYEFKVCDPHFAFGADIVNFGLRWAIHE